MRNYITFYTKNKPMEKQTIVNLILDKIKEQEKESTLALQQKDTVKAMKYIHKNEALINLGNEINEMKW